MRQPRRYRTPHAMSNPSPTGAVAQRLVDSFADDALAAARGTFERLHRLRGVDVDAAMARAFVDSFPPQATAAQMSLALLHRVAWVRADARDADRVVATFTAEPQEDARD